MPGPHVIVCTTCRRAGSGPAPPGGEASAGGSLRGGPVPAAAPGGPAPGGSPRDGDPRVGDPRNGDPGDGSPGAGDLREANLRDGARLFGALAAMGLPVRGLECLSACARGCAVAFAGPGRWTYVQGGLDPEADLDAVAAMAAAHAASADGLVPWRDRPAVIRGNTIARIPPQEA